jgi:hypothetical protein
MSDSPQTNAIDNTETLIATEPAAATPVAKPLAIEDPVSTSPTDPITGNGYTNTSNGNQVAVLSTIDYSTNTVNYNHHSTNIVNYNYYSINTVNENHTLTACPAEHSMSSNQYSMSGGNTASNSSLSAESPDDVTGTPGNASLQRNGLHLRFNSWAYFRSQGARRIDRIMGFNGANGDKLELSRRVFKGIGELEFESISNRRQLKRASKSDADIIYQESSGRLFFNANGDTKGFGDQGGMFAILESTPFLSANHVILI